MVTRPINTNLRLNPQKTKEMVVARRSLRFLPPFLRDGVQHVSSLPALGVTMEDNLRVTEHVASTLEECSRLLYALRELRSHGLPTRAVHQPTFSLKFILSYSQFIYLYLLLA